jgi:hypothetical protein
MQRTDMKINGTALDPHPKRGGGLHYLRYLNRINSQEHFSVTASDDLRACYMFAVLGALLLGKYKLGPDFTYIHIVASFIFPLLALIYFALC